MIIKIAFLILFFPIMAFAGNMAADEALYYYNEGVKEQKANNLVAADTYYQKAVLLSPYNLTWQKYILNNRGVIAAKQGDIETAEQAFNEALKIDPEYEQALLNLGMIYEMRRSRLESLEYWAKIFGFDRLKPKDFVMQGQEKEK